MTDIGELVVRIRADAAQLEREMKKANGIVKQSTGGMGDSFKTLKSQIDQLLPALTVGAFVKFGFSAFDAADKLDDFRKRTGFAVESLSALKTPLLIADSNLEEFSASIARMNNLVGEAASGINEMAVRAFDDLGLSVESLRKLSPEQQFYEIARALGGITNEADFTNKGMAIFGRSFVRIAPLIKDAGGEVEGFVEKAKQMGGVITQEQVDRVGDLNDRWTVFIEDTKKGLLGLIPVIEQLANVPNYLRAAVVEIPFQAGQAIGSRMKGGNPNVSDDRPASVNFATFMGDEQFGPQYQGQNARGSNAGLLNTKERAAEAKKIEDARAALDDYNRSLREESQILAQSPREQAALEARFKTEELARRGGITLTQEQIAANENLARTNYDLAESMKEAARFQQILHDKLSETLTDIAFKAGSAKEAMLGFAESIAKAAFEKKVAGPLADALIGSGGGKGLLDGVIGGFGKMLGFANGGSPPVGVPSIVGERGPEIFVPNTSGTIVPNHQLGGQSVTVYQTFSLNPGATEQTVAQLRNLVPSIMAETRASVFAAMQQGGAASRITGLRN